MNPASCVRRADGGPATNDPMGTITWRIFLRLLGIMINCGAGHKSNDNLLFSCHEKIASSLWGHQKSSKVRAWNSFPNDRIGVESQESHKRELSARAVPGSILLGVCIHPSMHDVDYHSVPFESWRFLRLWRPGAFRWWLLGLKHGLFVILYLKGI